MYIDIETGECVTLETLQAEFSELVKQGEKDKNDFSKWIQDCTGKNGFLKEC